MTSEAFLEKEYIHRINLALNFIDTHLDADELSLETISKVAFFSPFHFHRIFKAIIGETLKMYIGRRRIEKAVALLFHKNNLSITEVSLLVGFNSHASFSRAFKKFYGVSPLEFRKQNPNKFSKICHVESKKGQENLLFEKYICNITNHLNWIKMNATIEIKEITELHFASITHIGVVGIESTFEKLIKWAIPKGFMANPDNKLARIFHDSFKITAPNKVRMSISMLTDSSFKTEGELHKTTIKKGKCIVSRFEIIPTDFEKSWSALFVWMHDNGYKKRDENPFEIYHNDFRQHPEKKCLVDFYIPIE